MKNANPTNNSSIREELENSFVDLIDRYFPKGECKERGQAMVMMALAQQLITTHTDQILDEVVAEVDKLPVITAFDSKPNETRGLLNKKELIQTIKLYRGKI